ncbi:MAG: hypothetical protein ACRCVX_14685 [Shewanella sp.]
MSMENRQIVAKVLTSWVGAVWGGITLNNIVLCATAVYTVLQIYLLVRDKICRKRRRRSTDV